MLQPRPTADPAPLPSRRRWLRELAHPALAVANVTPNWFAVVMGTGIVATAAAGLPWQPPGLRPAATVVWGLAALLLLVLLLATAAHWVWFGATARRHHDDPVLAHFYGAPAMALMTVGAGSLLLGPDVLGERLAVGVAWVLWAAGTLLGLATAVLVPYLTFTRHRTTADSVFGGWLMPVVPPMVSAATGALLLPHLPAGQLRLTLFHGCYAMFGLSLLAAFAIITQLWQRLALHKVGLAAMVPTLWIVLGPLGQSITAANLLGGDAALVLDPTAARVVELGGVLFGVPVLGFALLWAAIATLITLRAVGGRLPFGLTWWSFTFPVGTCVTGASALAQHTGVVALGVLATGLYLALVAAWLVVGVRTLHGALVTGTLLAPPVAPAP
ncbi:C4-dicarboxylate ABC transporter [Desertihabitans brevis]|uniref:C4-dicarboxylate ABC transporter n=1 Tax=Desertihabitans brevis TaxID=2268447 RepID=A0A367YSG3_9ACTN|nr:TDT family transporter [Desertihabitans brevis]RCK68816.1 C4-dicarboxylate ABC transporter [Desertihabitans brevis]